MPDSIRVAQWGGFDVDNYGDELFPLIAKEQLTARLPGLELTCFAPVGNHALPPGSPTLFPLGLSEGSTAHERREYFARHFDAILVGGGDILRFNRLERGYSDSRMVSPYNAFLDFLWGECESQPEILWNSPGVPFPFERSRRLLVQQACSYVRHISVRDEVSRGYLLEAGVEEPIHVAPDSGILLKEVIQPRVEEGSAREILAREGAKLDGRRLLCFQCSPGFLRGQAKPVAQALSRVAERHDLEIVLLPIGLCHGDREALQRVKAASRGRFTLVGEVESPLEIGAIIGACDYFVGSSLHGNLTALSYGIPSLIVNRPDPLAKLEGLTQLAGMEDFRINDWPDLEETCDRLLASPRESWRKTGARLKSLASEHFDQLADLISRAADGRSEPYAASNGSVPLEALKTISGLQERLEDQQAELQLAPDKTQIEKRDQVIYEQERKLRNLEELQSLLDARNGQLTAKEKEVTELTQEVARLKRQLARINQQRSQES